MTKILSCGARLNFGLLACDRLAMEPAPNLLKLLIANALAKPPPHGDRLQMMQATGAAVGLSF
jgi:hypothetical protein